MMMRARLSRSVFLSLMAFVAILLLSYFPLSHTRASNVSASILPSAGQPLVNFKTTQTAKVTYTGDSSAVSALRDGTATPVSMAAGDFNADGAIDVIAGYSAGNGGVLALMMGNPDAYAPKDTTLYQKAMKGSVPATFLSKAATFALPESPDLMVTGDFNRDGYLDVLVAARGNNMYLLAGDGKGNFLAPQLVPLIGQVRALAPVGGAGHLAVSLEGPSGSELTILAPGSAGLAQGASYSLPARGDSVVVGNLGGGHDIAVGAGSNIVLVYNALSAKPQTETVAVPFNVMGLAVGNFIWDRDSREELAALADDGSIQILQHGTLNTTPFTAAEIPGRRAAMVARMKVAKQNPQSPTSYGAWAVAKQIPYAGSAPSGAVASSAFTSPQLAINSNSDLMLLDAGRSQLNVLDTSGAAASPSAGVSFSSSPVAAFAMPQKIDASRDIIVLTSAQSAPLLVTSNVTTTLNVNTTADDDSVGACSNSSDKTIPSTLTLREAVCLGNNIGGNIVINVPNGTYSLGNSTDAGTGELELGTVQSVNISIIGASQSTTIIQQTDGIDRIFEQDFGFNGNTPVSISNLSIWNGACTSGQDCTFGGGGMLGNGNTGDDLTLTNVTFNDNNSGGSDDGGGLSGAGDGNLTISGSVFSANIAPSNTNGGAAGGGVFYNPNAGEGNLSITNSTFTGNTSTLGGGGIEVEDNGDAASISGSVFTGNSAGTSVGGGIFSDGGTLTVSNSRIVGNIASGGGTGLAAEGGSADTATNNWWGCNGGPGASGCDTVFTGGGATASFNPWLVLTISANSTQISTNSSTGVTAAITTNSSGGTGFTVPNGTAVSFGATLGTISGASGTLTNGVGTATYNSGSTPGAGSASATVDTQQVSVTINVKGGTSTSVAVYDAGTASPWSGSEVTGASAYAASVVTPATSGGPAPSGTVTYNLYANQGCGGLAINSSTVSMVSGVVPNSPSSSPLPAGTYSYLATYSGDSNYDGSLSTCTAFTVHSAAINTSVNSSVNPSNFGQSVTFTAVLSGVSGFPPTGVVGFTSNGTTISGCSAVPVSSSTAQCTTSALPLGTDAIVATYSGDANYNMSSGTLLGGQQVDNPASLTATAVSSNNNPSFTTAPNNEVTFTATVTSNNTVNEGTVTFTDGPNNITCVGGNPASVINGTATCNTSFSTEGAHDITASYNGTVNFQSSSGGMTQVVNNHTVQTGNQFCNQGPITVPSTAGAATPYPSNIFVTGLGNVGTVTLTLDNISSSNIQQTDLLLVGPTGAALIPFANIGDSSTIGPINVTLDDSASNQLPIGFPLSSGSFKPTSATGGSSLVFPAPAPATTLSNYSAPDGTATLTSTFANTAANGTWALYAMDNSGNGAATIAGGWCVNISPATVPITITTSPANLLVSVDGGPSTVAPLVETWNIGSSHTIATFSPQFNGMSTQYVFSNWSDSGDISHSVIVPSSPTTYTATFNTQYELTTQALPAGDGTVTPPPGTFYASGATIPVTATANAGFAFNNWTSTGGSFDSSTSSSTNFHMPAAPATVTGNFVAATVPITITTSPANLLVSVDGGASVPAPLVETWDVGSSHTIATNSPQSGGTGIQYVFSSWSDGGAISHSIMVPSTASTYTAGFTTQYQLTTAASPINGGTVSPASGNFYNASTVVPLLATANAGFAFSNWTGNVANAGSASTSITLTSPQTVTANFVQSGPIVTLNPTSINFGTAYYLTAKTHNLIVTNTGNSTLTITRIGITPGLGTGQNDFTFLSFCPKNLAAGKSCNITVFFFAAKTGSLSATLNLTDNAPGSPQQVGLAANVINPVPSYNPPSLHFAPVKVGTSATKDVNLSNTGTTPLTVSNIAINGGNGYFTQTSNCIGTLNPGHTCQIAVTFAPGQKGSRTANLTVTDNALINKQNVPLSGSGD